MEIGDFRRRRFTREKRSGWLTVSGSKKYEYNVGDSLQIPDGAYDLKLKRDLTYGGIHELLHFESKYTKGSLDGPVKIHMYKISFNILDFDNADVVSETKGQKMRIEGMYSEGKPVGNWKFAHKNMDMPGDSSILNYNLDSRLIKYTSGRISGGGKVDENQFFDGEWIWQEGEVETIYTYGNGILTGISKANASLDTLLRIEKSFAETSDSIVTAEDFRKWVYFPGAEDNLEWLQSLVDRNMKRGWKAHDFADRQMSLFPNFTLPEIKGTARIYHRISPTNRSELKNQLQNIRFLDSLLMKEIELPVFQLRREKHSEVDSLLRGEKILCLEMGKFQI